MGSIEPGGGLYRACCTRGDLQSWGGSLWGLQCLGGPYESYRTGTFPMAPIEGGRAHMVPIDAGGVLLRL